MKFLICTYCIFVFSFNLLAEEHEGGGESETKGATPTDYIKKDEFLELNSAIEQMTAKIKAKKDGLKKLLQEKNEIKDPALFRDTVKKIETEYAELKEIIESAEKKQAILRFRYPDKGFVKQKKKINVQSLEELGAEASIEQDLNEAVDVIRNQYGHILKPKDKVLRNPAQIKEKNEVALPIKSDKNSESMPNAILDEDPTGTVILRK
jgi:prefoldin subunit 5